MTDERQQRRQLIYAQIEAERGRQDEQWGGPAHDDPQPRGKWLALIAEHRDRALKLRRWSDSFRHRLVVIAALCVAAIEAHDRRAR